MLHHFKKAFQRKSATGMPPRKAKEKIRTTNKANPSSKKTTRVGGVTKSVYLKEVSQEVKGGKVGSYRKRPSRKRKQKEGKSEKTAEVCQATMVGGGGKELQAEKIITAGGEKILRGKTGHKMAGRPKYAEEGSQTKKKENAQTQKKKKKKQKKIS